MRTERIETERIQVSAEAPDPAAIARAAGALRNGKLVAFPTETVYGLGANALDAAAVARIFAAKGRPAQNPVIVHVADSRAAQALVAEWPDRAAKLAAAFWPGPLTLVLPRREIMPDIVTAGGPTVAVRVPAHPIALALIRAAGVPVAAPSANRSMHLSPTRAEHVLRGLRGRIEMIVDGGPTTGGIESTVLSLAGDTPVLLRPGLVTPARIEAVIGPIQRKAPPSNESTTAALPSPGMLARHYAPQAPLEIQETGAPRVQALLAEGERVGWLTVDASALSAEDTPRLHPISMPRDPVAYAARLYAALHELDEAGVTRIVVDALPQTEDWIALRDRLQRASAAEEAR